MRQLIIGSRTITEDSLPYVIAEIGNTHCGNIKIAMQLIKSAKDVGCNAVKLQKKDLETEYTKAFLNEQYNNRYSYGKTYGDHKRRLEFGEAEYNALILYAKEIGITLFSTPFGKQSADFLNRLNMPMYKIASAHITDIQMIEHVAGFGKPIIISTGGCNWQDIDRAVETLRIKDSEFALLHCVAKYPCHEIDANLKIITQLKERYKNIVIGYSDHCLGIEIAEMAFEMGATIIEKHFTLDKTMKGRDHELSVDPIEMRKLINKLKMKSLILGQKNKYYSDDERRAIHKMGKSVHVIKPIKNGEKLTEENVANKIPADGIPAYKLNNILGKTVICDLSTADILEEDDIQWGK